MASWCCEWLSEYLKHDKEKGFSVYASKSTAGDAFFLQSCGFEMDVVEDFNKIDPKTGYMSFPEVKISSGKSVPLNMEIHMGITYCLHCGAKLKKIIKKNQKEFDRLATEHLELEEKLYGKRKID